MSEQAQQVFDNLCKAVETDQIKLPSLPEVALKIREAVEKDTHSAAEIAELLSQDSGLSARLLQLANSPLYRARAEIDNIQMAITRLGIRIVKDLVVMLAIKQAFKSSDKAIDQQFRDIWQSSIDVAAVCRVLAKSQTSLDSEHAVLAGLIHNIGKLPIIELADRQPSLVGNTENLKQVIDEIQGPLGKKILSFWNFPDSLIDVVEQWDNFERQSSEEVDYVDVVQAAILHTQQASPDTPKDWNNVAAIHKLGLDPALQGFDEETQQLLDNTRSSLMSI